MYRLWGLVRRRVLWVGAFALTGACAGGEQERGDSAVGGSSGAAGAATGGATMASPVEVSGAGAGGARCATVTERRLRRLSGSEYSHAVGELTGSAPAAFSLPDPTVHGFDTNADALGISSGNFEDYAISAELAASEVDVAALAPCASPMDSKSCARSFLEVFATQAFGRLVHEEEVASWMSAYEPARALGGYELGVRTLLQNVLLSPYFLYRVELGAEAQPSAEVELSPEETANVLAFALTGQRPDAELLALALQGGELLEAETRRSQANRLIRSEAGRRQLTRFLRGLFGIQDLRAVNKEPVRFPMYTPRIKEELDTEIALFLEHALSTGGGTLDAVLGGTHTFINQNLYDTLYAADYAEQPDKPVFPDAGTFVQVPFNPRLRRGLLGLAGFLAAHSPIHRTSPVDRAVTLRARLFCAPMQPPPGLMFNPPPPGDPEGTTRKKFEQHTQDKSCQACHRVIDPLGFGLEMIDTLGRYRTTENQLPVDSSGALLATDVDGPFAGPAELAARLMESQQVRACVVTQLFRFMEGRDERQGDACVLEPLQQYFKPRERSLADLAVEMVLSPNFFRRRTEP